MHQVLVEHELYRNVAKELRVGVTTICRVVKKAQSKPRFLDELVEKRDREEAHRRSIETAVRYINEKGKIIDSVDRLRKTLQEEYGIEAKER